MSSPAGLHFYDSGNRAVDGSNSQICTPVKTFYLSSFCFFFLSLFPSRVATRGFFLGCYFLRFRSEPCIVGPTQEADLPPTREFCGEFFSTFLAQPRIVGAVSDIYRTLVSRATRFGSFRQPCLPGSVRFVPVWFRAGVCLAQGSVRPFLCCSFGFLSENK